MASPGPLVLPAAMSETERRPHFDRPPVIEVVCGIQFEALEGWQTPHYGQFGRLLAEEYPEFEDRSPLPTLRLEPAPGGQPQVFPLPPLRRVFFVKPPGNFLIQLQENRFLHNWRKVRDEDEYPRYDAAYDRFVRYWQEFRQFLVDVHLPAPRPEIFELTYINHIMAEGAAFPRDVWTFLGFYEKRPEATTAMEATGMMMHLMWPLPKGMGNLTLDVKHGNRVTDQKEVLMMELTARGRAPGDAARMEEWFDVAHDAIVNTFDELTTKHAHQIWGKHE